jgi:hypothetical protein
MFFTMSRTCRDAFKPPNRRRLPHGSPPKFAACSDSRPLRPCPRPPGEPAVLFPFFSDELRLCIRRSPPDLYRAPLGPVHWWPPVPSSIPASSSTTSVALSNGAAPLLPRDRPPHHVLPLAVSLPSSRHLRFSSRFLNRGVRFHHHFPPHRRCMSPAIIR